MEDYKSPFSFEQGLNTNYLYLSPKESFTPPSSPTLPCRGKLCVVAHVQIMTVICGMQHVIEDTEKYLFPVFELH